MVTEKQKIGIIGLITLLLGVGGGLVIPDNQIKDSYYCTATDEIGIFLGGISSTGYTAYPYTDSKTGYERCTNGLDKGVWIPLIDYLKQNNLTLDMLEEQQDITPLIKTSKLIKCKQTGCEII